MPRISKDLFYYLSLFFILFLGGVSIYLAFPNRNLQVLLLATTGFFYFLWGILHHYLNHDLIAKTVIEYALIALLGVVIATFALKGGSIF